MNHELTAIAAQARELRTLLAAIGALAAPTASRELVELFSMAGCLSTELANDAGVLAEMACCE